MFEPLSLAFARRAIARLDLRSGERVLDVAAGAGGAALAMAEAGAARHGHRRIARHGRADPPTRRGGACRRRRPRHGRQALDFPDAAFDAALSVFGVILFPDAARGLAEMRRVVRPGGRVAVVTWTQPHRYELAANLREAILAVGPEPPRRPRCRRSCASSTPRRSERLFAEAGFDDVAIETAEAHLQAPSARWLAERIRFAPGMDAWLSSLGERSAAALDASWPGWSEAQGRGPVDLGAVASIGVARV